MSQFFQSKRIIFFRFSSLVFAVANICVFMQIMITFSTAYLHTSPFLNNMLAKSRLGRFSILRSTQSISRANEEMVSPRNRINPMVISFKELSEVMGGSGKARMIWDQLKEGKNPLSKSDENPLSDKAIQVLKDIAENESLVESEIQSETLSECGTRKLLIKLPKDGLVESVLIPSYKFDRTTLCVSTQIGCDRRCLFCATGKMGLQRNLTANEILSQVFRGIEVSKRENMPILSNIVFMGMGDAGRNTVEVGKAVNALTDRDRFSFGQSKVTISTVGPSPEIFSTIAEMPGTIAWSLHAADDELRKKLVPSTKHTTVELRDGLMEALSKRKSLKSRTIMIALTLIDGVNDSDEDAYKLAEFIRPMLSVAPKIALDLIPYNDIGVTGLGRPNHDRVCAFQAILRKEGYFCSVRVTRGDGESAACGMLTTKKAMMQERKQTSSAGQNSSYVSV